MRMMISEKTKQSIVTIVDTVVRKCTRKAALGDSELADLDTLFPFLRKLFSDEKGGLFPTPSVTSSTASSKVRRASTTAGVNPMENEYHCDDEQESESCRAERIRDIVQRQECSVYILANLLEILTSESERLASIRAKVSEFIVFMITAVYEDNYWFDRLSSALFSTALILTEALMGDIQPRQPNADGTATTAASTTGKSGDTEVFVDALSVSFDYEDAGSGEALAAGSGRRVEDVRRKSFRLSACGRLLVQLNALLTQLMGDLTPIVLPPDDGHFVMLLRCLVEQLYFATRTPNDKLVAAACQTLASFTSCTHTFGHTRRERKSLLACVTHVASCVLNDATKWSSSTDSLTSLLSALRTTVGSDRHEFNHNQLANFGWRLLDLLIDHGVRHNEPVLSLQTVTDAPNVQLINSLLSLATGVFESLYNSRSYLLDDSRRHGNALYSAMLAFMKALGEPPSVSWLRHASHHIQAVEDLTVALVRFEQAQTTNRCAAVLQRGALLKRLDTGTSTSISVVRMQRVWSSDDVGDVQQGDSAIMCMSTSGCGPLSSNVSHINAPTTFVDAHASTPTICSSDDEPVAKRAKGTTTLFESAPSPLLAAPLRPSDACTRRRRAPTSSARDDSTSVEARGSPRAVGVSRSARATVPVWRAHDTPTSACCAFTKPKAHQTLRCYAVLLDALDNAVQKRERAAHLMLLLSRGVLDASLHVTLMSVRVVARLAAISAASAGDSPFDWFNADFFISVQQLLQTYFTLLAKPSELQGYKVEDKPSPSSTGLYAYLKLTDVTSAYDQLVATLQRLLSLPFRARDERLRERLTSSLAASPLQAYAAWFLTFPFLRDASTVKAACAPLAQALDVRQVCILSTSLSDTMDSLRVVCRNLPTMCWRADGYQDWRWYVLQQLAASNDVQARLAVLKCVPLLSVCERERATCEAQQTTLVRAVRLGDLLALAGDQFAACLHALADCVCAWQPVHFVPDELQRRLRCVCRCDPDVDEAARGWTAMNDLKPALTIATSSVARLDEGAKRAVLRLFTSVWAHCTASDTHDRQTLQDALALPLALTKDKSQQIRTAARDCVQRALNFTKMLPSASVLRGMLTAKLTARVRAIAAEYSGATVRRLYANSAAFSCSFKFIQLCLNSAPSSDTLGLLRTDTRTCDDQDSVEAPIAFETVRLEAFVAAVVCYLRVGDYLTRVHVAKTLVSFLAAFDCRELFCAYEARLFDELVGLALNEGADDTPTADSDVANNNAEELEAETERRIAAAFDWLETSITFLRQLFCTARESVALEHFEAVKNRRVAIALSRHHAQAALSAGVLRRFWHAANGVAPDGATSTTLSRDGMFEALVAHALVTSASNEIDATFTLVERALGDLLSARESSLYDEIAAYHLHIARYLIMHHLHDAPRKCRVALAYVAETRAPAGYLSQPGSTQSLVTPTPSDAVPNDTQIVRQLEPHMLSVFALFDSAFYRLPAGIDKRRLLLNLIALLQLLPAPTVTKFRARIFAVLKTGLLAFSLAADVARYDVAATLCRALTVFVRRVEPKALKDKDLLVAVLAAFSKLLPLAPPTSYIELLRFVFDGPEPMLRESFHRLPFEVPRALLARPDCTALVQAVRRVEVTFDALPVRDRVLKLVDMSHHGSFDVRTDALRRLLAVVRNAPARASDGMNEADYAKLANSLLQSVIETNADATESRLLIAQLIGLLGALDPAVVDQRASQTREDRRRDAVRVAFRYSVPLALDPSFVHALMVEVAKAYSVARMSTQQDALAFVMQKLMGVLDLRTLADATSVAAAASDADVTCEGEATLCRVGRAAWTKLDEAYRELYCTFVDAKYHSPTQLSALSAAEPFYRSASCAKFPEWTATWLRFLIEQLRQGPDCSHMYSLFSPCLAALRHNPQFVLFLLPHLLMHTLTRGGAHLVETVTREARAVITKAAECSTLSSRSSSLSASASTMAESHSVLDRLAVVGSNLPTPNAIPPHVQADADYTLLSCQQIFKLLDLVARWRLGRIQQLVSTVQRQTTPPVRCFYDATAERGEELADEAYQHVSRFLFALTETDKSLMLAALNCKAYVRALYYAEQYYNAVRRRRINAPRRLAALERVTNSSSASSTSTTSFHTSMITCETGISPGIAGCLSGVSTGSAVSDLVEKMNEELTLNVMQRAYLNLHERDGVEGISKMTADARELSLKNLLIVYETSGDVAQAAKIYDHCLRERERSLRTLAARSNLPAGSGTGTGSALDALSWSSASGAPAQQMLLSSLRSSLHESSALHEYLLQSYLEQGLDLSAKLAAQSMLSKSTVLSDTDRRGIAQYAVDALTRLNSWDELDEMLREYSKNVRCVTDAVAWPVGIARILTCISKPVCVFESHNASVADAALRVPQYVADLRQAQVSPIVALCAESKSYQSAYEYIVNLHTLSEVDDAAQLLSSQLAERANDGPDVDRADWPAKWQTLLEKWRSRLQSVQPSHTVCEKVLRLRRSLLGAVLHRLDATAASASGPTALPSGSGSMMNVSAGVSSPKLREMLNKELGWCWLRSAKLHRKAGLLQEANGLLIKAVGYDPKQCVYEHAKLCWLAGHKQQAQTIVENGLHKYFSAPLRELETAQQAGATQQSASSGAAAPTKICCVLLKPPHNDSATRTYIAKLLLLRARINEECALLDTNALIAQYKDVARIAPEMESAYYRLARYYDDMATRSLTSAPDGAFVPHIVNWYGEALLHGHKYLYEALPRMLTIWLDFGDKLATDESAYASERRPGASSSSRAPPAPHARPSSPADADRLRALNKIIEEKLLVGAKHVETAVTMSAFSTLTSRICHENQTVWNLLKQIILQLMLEYLDQTMWMTMALQRSYNQRRKNKCTEIIGMLRARPSSGELLTKISCYVKLGNLLQQVNERQIASQEFVKGREFNVHHLFPQLTELFNNRHTASPIVPIQSLLCVKPSTRKGTEKLNRLTFGAPAAVTIRGVSEQGEEMASLQHPKKIVLLGSDGKSYPLLLKARDDMRKDSRVMEFFAMINEFALRDPEARKRQLHIRTYAVVPLDEHCGVIEWVQNTMAYRAIVTKLQQERKQGVSSGELQQLQQRGGKVSEKERLEQFRRLLAKSPPVFGEWFLRTFTDPSSWFTARLNYCRTAAVMSVVGHIVGVGDRHAENLLLDQTNGDCVHVDFGILFDQGTKLKVPEIVPFRLTANMQEAMGPSRYEGIFRLSCEVTMRLMRKQIGSLMNMLRPFITDPLVDWNKVPEQQRSERGLQIVEVQESAESRRAQSSLKRCENRLRGLLIDIKFTESDAQFSMTVGVEGHVNYLIEHATDERRLADMFIGWAAYL